MLIQRLAKTFKVSQSSRSNDCVEYGTGEALVWHHLIRKALSKRSPCEELRCKFWISGSILSSASTDLGVSKKAHSGDLLQRPMRVAH